MTTTGELLVSLSGVFSAQAKTHLQSIQLGASGVVVSDGVHFEVDASPITVEVSQMDVDLNVEDAPVSLDLQDTAIQIEIDDESPMLEVE